VTTDLPAWFGQYNARQTIEAGIKETKQVFTLHRLKVRSEPAIFLQEALTLFAGKQLFFRDQQPSILHAIFLRFLQFRC
jgi:hypothetical protein